VREFCETKEVEKTDEGNARLHEHVPSD